MTMGIVYKCIHTEKDVKIKVFLSMLCKKQSKNGDKNTGKIRVIHKLSTKSG